MITKVTNTPNKNTAYKKITRNSLYHELIEERGKTKELKKRSN